MRQVRKCSLLTLDRFGTESGSSNRVTGRPRGLCLHVGISFYMDENSEDSLLQCVNFYCEYLRNTEQVGPEGSDIKRLGNMVTVQKDGDWVLKCISA